MTYRAESPFESTDFVLRAMCTHPEEIFGKIYAGYIILLFGAAEERLATTIARALSSLDAMTGNDVGLLIFFAQPSTRALGTTSTKEKVSHKSIMFREWSSDRSFRHRWTPEETVAISYATERVAESLGVLERVPCAVYLDYADLRVGQFDGLRGRGYVLDFQEGEFDHFVRVTRRALQCFRSNPCYASQQAKIRQLAALQSELQRVNSSLRQLEDREVCWERQTASREAAAVRGALCRLDASIANNWHFRLRSECRRIKKLPPPSSTTLIADVERLCLVDRATIRIRFLLGVAFRSLSNSSQSLARASIARYVTEVCGIVVEVNDAECLSSILAMLESEKSARRNSIRAAIQNELAERILREQITSADRARERNSLEEAHRSLAAASDSAFRGLAVFFANVVRDAANDLLDPTRVEDTKPVGPMGNAWRQPVGLPMPDARRINVFISYSHADDPHRVQLENHLSVLVRSGLIATWSDRKITAGSEWKGAINDNLQKAELILLLVSPDFVASDYCWDVEMTRAIQRHEAHEAQVIPILIRDVEWVGAPFGKLQALPRNGKPITSGAWHSVDEAWRTVTNDIRTAIVSHWCRPRKQGL